nr:MAG TPA: NAD-dependent DNA ligase (contains BRCT domain type II) [Caudoviricetes sp.]
MSKKINQKETKEETKVVNVEAKKETTAKGVTDILTGNVPTVEGSKLPRDNNGFVSLKRTAKGEAAIEEIKRKRSKKNADVKSEPEKPTVSYDEEKVKEVLDAAVEFVKAGKYKKAKDLDLTEVKKFCEAFLNVTPDDKEYDHKIKLAMELMAIGKSFYEYSDLEFVDDAHYDNVRNKYQKLGETEPIGIIPKGAKNLQKVELTYPTLSNNVDKAYIIRADDKVPDGVKESDSVEAFLKRVYKNLDLAKSDEVELEISPKLDGVSVNGTIKDSMLINPQTRGDESESILIKGLNGIDVCDAEMGPTEDDDKVFGIQYECFVTDEDRIKASEYLKLDNPYVSCRHAAAGITHRLATMEDDDLLQYLSFYPIATEGLEGTYVERMKYIQAFGIVPKDMAPRKVIKGNFDELLDKIVKQYNRLNDIRPELSYPVDGMVITVCDDDYQTRLGRNGRTNRFQIAMKFDPATATATVDHLDLEAGDKGYRTIQVYFKEDAIIDGVRYDHVPVLSAALFDELELCENSEVKVHRVGDVIPSITKVTDGNGVKLKKPEKCPVCGSKLLYIAKKLYCDNPDCAANIAGKFNNFFKTLDLDDYSDSFAKALVDGGIRTIKSMIELTPEKLAKIGLTGKRAEAFPKAVKAALETEPDYVVVAALGIPNVGKERAKKLLSAVSFEKLATDEYITIHLEQPLVDKFGVVGVNIYHAIMFHLDEFKDVYPYVKNFTKDFDNMITVGHTGGKISDEAMEIIKKYGFAVTDGKKFDVLIVPEWGHKSTKVDIAMKKDVAILTNDAFIDMYKDYNGEVKNAKKPSEKKTEEKESSKKPKNTKVSTSKILMGNNIW